MKIGEESKHGSAGMRFPSGSTYGNIEALKVNPSLGDVVLDKTKFVIAPFLQHESHVNCHPVGGGEPGKLTG